MASLPKQIADANNYGKVKLSDTANSEQGVDSGVAATPKMVSDSLRYKIMENFNSLKWFEYEECGTGTTVIHYEGTDATAMKLPYSYVDVYVTYFRKNRGTAIAISWRSTTTKMWVAGLQDTWTNWKEVTLT